jgi:hypothetical protein
MHLDCDRPGNVKVAIDVLNVGIYVVEVAIYVVKVAIYVMKVAIDVPQLLIHAPQNGVADTCGSGLWSIGLTNRKPDAEAQRHSGDQDRGKARHQRPPRLKTRTR